MSKVVIIGGGLAGLAAAYRLASHHQVTVIEKDEILGGMLQSYHINDYYIEKFYHHFFSGDNELSELINELGLRDQVVWLKGNTGYYREGRAYPMNTPLEILKFPPLSIIDIFKLGLLVMRAKTIKDIRPYDTITAKEWIIRIAGKGVYNNFFLPLLTSKFGKSADKVSAAWLLGRVKIRSDRGTQGERLGYMKAGFYQLIHALTESIDKKGGRIISGNPVRTIHFDSVKPSSVELQRGTLQCDVVISTASPMTLSGLIKPGILDLNLDQIRYQGTCCALLGISESLMKDGTYWLNIDAEVPFGALIEHTNFMPVQDYRQEHLVYIASYFQDPEDTLYTADREKVIKKFIQSLEYMFPDFDQSSVLWWKLTRDIQTAPVYETGYADTILPYCTNVKGLYLAGMFSEANYPERSMNDSIKAGYKAAEAVLHESDL